MALILLALIVVPVVEIYVLLQVGHQIGVLQTVLLLIAVSVLGTWLIRREGTRAWSALGAAIRAGRIPTREVADGALVVLGGALLLTPGFVTDIVGVLCIVPPTRTLLRRALIAQVARRATGGRSRRRQTNSSSTQGPSTIWVQSDRADAAAGPRPGGPVIDGELEARGEGEGSGT